MAHTIGITPLGGVNGDFFRPLYHSVSLFLVDGVDGLGGLGGVGSVILPYIYRIYTVYITDRILQRTVYYIRCTRDYASTQGRFGKSTK